MPQTLLALLALMIASTLSFQWQRDNMRAQMNLIEAELQVEARGVVSEVFERVAELRFDEATSIATVADLTAESAFGANRLFTDPGVDDLDDLHRMRPYTLRRSVTSPLTGDPVDIDFVVTAEVDYVDDANGEELRWAEGRKTFYKRFTVIVRPQVGFNDANRAPITVSRVFSYEF